jgi:two-component system sensor histidine kinase/response regulator
VRLPFRIRPAPWKTWWAYTLYAGAIGGVGYAGMRYRVQALQRRSEELEAIVAERTAELAESERKALEANRAKSVFLSSMSHELRTPLNAVIGFAQLMERDPHRGPEDREHLATITRSGEHLLDLINDVLSIAKIEAGKLTLAEQVFDLRRLLVGTEEMIRVRADEKGLRLVFDLAPDLPRAVLGDEGKLRQVLVNLLGNAVKFTDRGQVVLRASWRDGTTAFEVEDTGQGISEEEIGQIFESFVQSESGRKSREGTGLGLAISRSFVQVMGGDLRVSSEVGVGTTFGFEVRLPIAGEAEAIEERRTAIGIVPPEDREAAYRVLVVDDAAENRTLLVKLLAPVGFDVREAANGEEAVEIWSSWQPDLIFMDIRMPVVDGVEATRRVRAAEGARGEGRGASQKKKGLLLVPRTSSLAPCTIVALTASAFEHDRERILAAGCDDFVAKPFREATIFEKLSEHLGVRFVYREESQAVARSAEPVLTPSRLAALPEEMVARLRLGLDMGDDQAALEAIDRIHGHDEPLARELRRAIKGYQFAELLELISTIRRQEG